MPYPLNNVATQDTYVDAATAVFPRPTDGFSVQVYNAGIFYRLLYVPRNTLRTGAYQEDAVEHFAGPSFITFSQADAPDGGQFAGIRFRSAVAGVPANVTA